MKNIVVLFISLIFFHSPIPSDKRYKKNLKLNQKISVLGQERNYHIYVPNNSQNRPVVVLLHGNRGSANQILGRSWGKSPHKIWLELAELNNFILLVPDGNKSIEGYRGWNDCRTDAVGNPNSNDVLFISNLLESTQIEYNYDPNKVYISGISNGGMMASRLAMEIPEKITALASVVSSMPINSSCIESNVPISILFMNGTKDPLLPYDGGHIKSERGEVKSTKECINYWVSRNNTTTTPIETILNDTNSSDNSQTIKYIYPNGTNNTEVVLYKIINGGHTEPSLSEHYHKIYKRIVGNQSKDFEMANKIWEFFKDKSK